MENPWIDLTPATNVQTICARVVQDAVVATAPALETPPHVVRSRTWLESHEGVGEAVLNLVVLRRKVVGLRLALAANELGVRITLVHVMRNGPHVVEELAEDVPTTLLRHDVRTEQRVTGDVHNLFQLNAPS